MTPKKRKTGTPTAAKRGKPDEKEEPRSYPDADPEWEHLEERYSTIGSEMRSLAKLLNVGGGGGDEQP